MSSVDPPKTTEEIEPFVEAFIESQMMTLGERPSDEAISRARNMAERFVEENDEHERQEDMARKRLKRFSVGSVEGAETSGLTERILDALSLEDSTNTQATTTILKSVEDNAMNAETAYSLCTQMGMDKDEAKVEVAKAVIKGRQNTLKQAVDPALVDMYATKEEAETRAAELGCEGSHPHEMEDGVVYMPCEGMADYLVSTSSDGVSKPKPIKPIPGLSTQEGNKRIDLDDVRRSEEEVVSQFGSLLHRLFVRWDLNGDGVVDGADWLIWLNQWIADGGGTGTECDGCPGDYNGDGVVDGDDIRAARDDYDQVAGGTSPLTEEDVDKLVDKIITTTKLTDKEKADVAAITSVIIGIQYDLPNRVRMAISEAAGEKPTGSKPVKIPPSTGFSTVGGAGGGG